MKPTDTFYGVRIARLHLELTEKCNAACPLCIRTNPDGLRPQSYLGTQELRLDDLRAFLPVELRRNLLEVHMCGSYGDPIMAKDCLAIAALFCTPNCSVSLSTNGSARSTRWWSELGRILAKNPKSRVDFHIDGLADTNSFYRRNTSFAKIIKNATAFIEAGGQANWEFIPFKHNEHQIEQARELSRQLNFARFTIKKSNWIFSEERPKIAFTDRNGKTCYLEKPSSIYMPDKGKTRASVIPDSDNQEINCLALFQNELYISCESIVYPCCWVARHARNIYLGKDTKDGFSELFKRYNGNEIFNLKRHSLEEMLHSDFFMALSEWWSTNQPPICFKKCGLKNQPEKIKTTNVTKGG
jgi:MoaA/NifB/PqqE/SkfB family radical SAM enzyme